MTNITDRQKRAIEVAIPGINADELFASLAAQRVLGTGVSDSVTGDIDGRFVTYNTNATANTADTVTHSLGRVPVGYVVYSSQKGGVPYYGGVAATSTQITLKCTVASETLGLLLF